MFSIRTKLLLKPLLSDAFMICINVIALYSIVKNANYGAAYIAVFIQSLMQLHIAISSFSEQSSWVAGHLLFFEKYFNFLSSTETMKLNSRKVKVSLDKELVIEFKNVDFAYSDGRKILENLSFKISNKKNCNCWK